MRGREKVRMAMSDQSLEESQCGVDFEEDEREVLCYPFLLGLIFLNFAVSTYKLYDFCFIFL